MYIHKLTCVSAQTSLIDVTAENINESVDNVLKVVEPKYEGIPLSILRRMGKAVRMGVGTALPLLKSGSVELNGIVIGTSNGGMEDCIKFLNQVIEFEEGTLTPTNFVQSTPNAIASQLSLLSTNKGYNITHVNRGLAFENALLDVMMLLIENPDHSYLLGGVEEISTYNYNIDNLAGWFKREAVSNKKMYDVVSEGTISGEGAAMFVVNAEKKDAIACVQAVKLVVTDSTEELAKQLVLFLEEHLVEGEEIDLFLSGENADSRSLPFFETCETVLKDVTVARYKHLTGDFATASALSLYFACKVIQQQIVPEISIKSGNYKKSFNRIFIYNTYKAAQHSFMLVESGL